MAFDIEELRKLAQAATPGPWEVSGGTVDQSWPVGCEEVIPSGVSCSQWCYGGTPEKAKDCDLAYIAAANPATVLGLIAEIERLRDEVNGLTGTADALERQLSESRNNDITAMGYLADCRIASGDNGKRMLPDFVEYLRETKQQRDELLSSLRDVVGWVPGREKWHTDEPIKAVSRARAVIANAEKTK